jgi:carboxyl-terminal processing protease
MPFDRLIAARAQALLLGFVLLLGAVPGARAAAKPFYTTPTMQAETRMIINYLEKQHYLGQSLDQLEPKALIRGYLTDLDPARMFMERAMVEQFVERYAPTLLGQLRRGDLSAAFEMYQLYRATSTERIDWVLQRLEGPFDFSERETYSADRAEAQWPGDLESANQLWERRLKYDLLNLALSRLSLAEKDLPETLEDPEVPGNDPQAIAEALADGEPEEPQNFEEALVLAKETLTKRFQYLKESIELTEALEVQEVFLTALTHQYDPHSTFMSSETLEEFEIAMHNSLVGIGAVLTEEDGTCEIRELIVGGPARKGGELSAGDRIVGVAQGEAGEMVDVVGMRLRKIVQQIRGEKGTTVRLLIQPAGEDPSARKVVSIVRDKVKLTANLASAEVYQVPIKSRTYSIGVIDLPAFYGSDTTLGESSTTDDVRELIGKLKQVRVEGIILDLRYNGGGLLSEAVALTGLFIRKGPVVQIKNVHGHVQALSDRDRSIAWAGPLMVLVSSYSASASEIAAGALQNYGRALIVGDKETHGKGTVQAVFPLGRSPFLSRAVKNRGAAKVTVQQFYLPDGSSTQLHGVRSDIVVPSLSSYLAIAERDLTKPVPFDTIRAARLVPLSGTMSVDDPLIDDLRIASEQRQSSLPEFDYLNDNIERLREGIEQKTFTLNLEQRQTDRLEDKAFREEMDARIEALTDLRFEAEEVLVSLAHKRKQAQQAQDAAAGLDPDSTEADEAQPPSLDIPLREGLRIMADWVDLLKQDGSAPMVGVDQGPSSEVSAAASAENNG